jgi:hypothetical protein
VQSAWRGKDEVLTELHIEIHILAGDLFAKLGKWTCLACWELPEDDRPQRYRPNVVDGGYDSERDPTWIMMRLPFPRR